MPEQWEQQDKVVTSGADWEQSDTVVPRPGLLKRAGTELYNLIPETINGILTTAAKFGPGEFEQTQRAQEDILAGKHGQKAKEELELHLAKAERQAKHLQPIPVSAPVNLAEKGVDVTIGTAKFIAQLVALKHGMPAGTPEGVLWEMQNLASGGTPGRGAAMYGLFSAPGKLIPGVSKLAKGGRLATESALLGGASAIEQKLTTGEVNWEDVAIQAGIPVALRSVRAIRAAVRRGDPKIIKAVGEVMAKQAPQEEIVPPAKPQKQMGVTLANYDETVKPIQDKIDVLEESGVSQNDPRLKQFYEQRFAMDEQAIDDYMSIVHSALKDTGITDNTLTFTPEYSIAQDVYGAPKEGSKNNLIAMVYERGQDAFSNEIETKKKLAEKIFRYQMEKQGIDPEGVLGPTSALTETGKVQVLRKAVDIAERVHESIKQQLMPRSKQVLLPAPAPAAGQQAGKPNIERTFDEVNALSEKQLKAEAISLKKTHVQLGAGQQEFEGMYLSTEQGGNRYATPETPAKEILADIQNPKIFRHATEYVSYHEKFLPEGWNSDNLVPHRENPEWQQLKKAIKDATDSLKEQGYDSVYLPESKTNEGILVVFDRGKVKQTPPAPAPAVAPVTPAPAAPVVPGNTQTVIDKLVPELEKSLKTQKKLRKGVELAYSKERGRRAEAQTKYLYELLAGKMGETEAMYKSRSKFADELIGEEDRISQEAIPQLSDTEWDVLQRKVIDTYPKAFRAYSRLRASEAINKIRRGEVLQNNEIEAVNKILGLKVSKLLRKQQPFSDRLLRNLFDVTGLTKVVGSSGDISYAFKQIWTGFYRSPTTWARSVVKGTKAFFSQEQFNRSQQEIKDSKYYEEALEHRLQLTDMDEFGSRSNVEESFPGRLASSWPLARQGNRAAVTKANQLRMGLYEKIRNLWERQGVPITDARLNKLAGMINDFSGRSNIPRGPRVQALFNFLNVIGYSPRFALSRVKNVVTLFHTLSTDPYIAKEGLKTLAGYIATTTTIALLADILGHKVELNPYSTDWMKPKKGHTRLDYQAGHGQVIRFIIQMAIAKQKTEAGEIKDISRKDVFMKFIKSKRAPIIGLISEIWTGRDFSGQPIEGIGGWTKELVEHFLYLWLVDAVDAFTDAHESEDLLTSLGLGAKAAVASWVGIGVQTYPPKVRTEVQIGKNSYAQVEYGKNWDELNPLQQRKLAREHKQEFEEAEQRIKVEGTKERDYEFLSRMAEQEREAGDVAIKGLSSGAKDELGRLGVTILLSREINNYKLNDKHYSEYQQTVARQLKKPLEQLLSSPLWSHYSDKRKVEKIQRKIMLAKRAAQRETIRGVNTNE